MQEIWNKSILQSLGLNLGLYADFEKADNRTLISCLTIYKFLFFFSR